MFCHVISLVAAAIGHAKKKGRKGEGKFLNSRRLLSLSPIHPRSLSCLYLPSVASHFSRYYRARLVLSLRFSYKAALIPRGGDRMEVAMSRKICALSFCIISAIAAIGTSQTDSRTDVLFQGTGNTVVLSLKDQLNTGLLARTPQERKFNDKVVGLVQEGKLPISLVQSTFFWARRKQPYPMPYFERALRIRAKNAGIKF